GFKSCADELIGQDEVTQLHPLDKLLMRPRPVALNIHNGDAVAGPSQRRGLTHHPRIGARGAKHMHTDVRLGTPLQTAALGHSGAATTKVLLSHCREVPSSVRVPHGATTISCTPSSVRAAPKSSTADVCAAVLRLRATPAHARGADAAPSISHAMVAIGAIVQALMLSALTASAAVAAQIPAYSAPSCQAASARLRSILR